MPGHSGPAAAVRALSHADRVQVRHPCFGPRTAPGALYPESHAAAFCWLCHHAPCPAGPVQQWRGGPMPPVWLGYSAAGSSFPLAAGMQVGFGVPSPALRQGANPNVCARIGAAVGISRCLAIFAPSKAVGRTLFLTGTLATTGVGARRVNAAGLGVASAGSFATDDGQVRNGRYGRHGGRLFRARRSAIDPKRPDGLSAVPDRAPVKNGTSPALRIRLSRPRKPCHPAITGGRFKRVRSGQNHVCRPSLGPVRQSIAAICPCPARWVGHPPGQTGPAPARRVRAMKFPRGWYRAKRFVVCPGHAKSARVAGWCRVCVVDDTCRAGRAMASRRGIEPLFPG